MKKDVKLYVAVPQFISILGIVLFPLSGACIGIGLIVINSIALILISLIVFRKFNKQFLKRTVLKSVAVSGGGYLLTGLLGLLILTLSPSILHVSEVELYDNVYITSVAIFIGIIAMSFANYFFTFRKVEITRLQKAISSIVIAVVSAPYIYYLPSSLLIR